VGGQVFRPVNRGDEIQGSALSEKVVWQLLQGDATAAGVPGIAPHDFAAMPNSGLCRMGSAMAYVAGRRP
jgi:hypothetical protein